jgi:hypothetical protein
MNGLLIGVHIVREHLLVSLLFEGDFTVDWVVDHFDDVAGGELGSLVLAVELHLVAVPGVSVWTDQVVSVVGVGVAEVEVYALDAVQVGDPNSNPWGEFLHLYLPLLNATSYYIRISLHPRLGSSSIIRWLPWTVMLALVGDEIVMHVPFNYYENLSLNDLIEISWTVNRESTSLSSKLPFDYSF